MNITDVASLANVCALISTARLCIEVPFCTWGGEFKSCEPLPNYEDILGTMKTKVGVGKGGVTVQVIIQKDVVDIMEVFIFVSLNHGGFILKWVGKILLAWAVKNYKSTKEEREKERQELEEIKAKYKELCEREKAKERETPFFGSKLSSPTAPSDTSGFFKSSLGTNSTV